MSIFETLNKINVNEHVEKKNNLSYLSWAWAWAKVKEAYPEAIYTVYENADGWNYFTDGRTCWVKTGVTIEGLEHIEYLPVMDYKNRSIPWDTITSFDVNKAIQRSLTKACARHGLGLYIYAGEDLPEEEAKERDEKLRAQYSGKANAAEKKTFQQRCELMNLDRKEILAQIGITTAEQWKGLSKDDYGKLCLILKDIEAKVNG